MWCVSLFDGINFAFWLISPPAEATEMVISVQIRQQQFSNMILQYCSRSHLSLKAKRPPLRQNIYRMPNCHIRMRSDLPNSLYSLFHHNRNVISQYKLYRLNCPNLHIPHLFVSAVTRQILLWKTSYSLP